MLLAYIELVKQLFHKKIIISLCSYIRISGLLGVQNPINYMGACTWHESYTVHSAVLHWKYFFEISAPGWKLFLKRFFALISNMASAVFLMRRVFFYIGIYVKKIFFGYYSLSNTKYKHIFVLKKEFQALYLLLLFH